MFIWLIMECMCYAILKWFWISDACSAVYTFDYQEGYENYKANNYNRIQWKILHNFYISMFLVKCKLKVINQNQVLID